VIRLLAASILIVVLAALPACAPAGPVVVSREALGTVVSVTAYGEDEAAVRDAIDAAYAAMAAVEAELDVHDPDSALSAFNADPYEPRVLPADASAILDAVLEADVAAEFSPGLLAVTRLYGFENEGRVPSPDELAIALMASREFGCTGDGNASFSRLLVTDPGLEPGGALAPGLDFGGAAKGLALDRAREALRASGAVTAALISTTSSTVTLGTKPDASVWRVGVEDPREPGRVLAVFAFEADGALSTSGDYQRYFEVDGVRYHHIIDPATGLPARGLRSLTVAGSSLSGLNSDILSTALFVKGGDGAIEYARERGLALYAVDAEGQALLVPAPDKSGLSVAEEAAPLP
jgi:thiamine biosynthesis lipoprotein